MLPFLERTGISLLPQLWVKGSPCKTQLRALARVRVCALMGLICIKGYFRRSTLEHLSLASSTNVHKLQLGSAREFIDSTIGFMYLSVYYDC